MKRHQVTGRQDFLNDPQAPTVNSLMPAASVIAFDPAGRILLQRRTDNDKWALPGGVMRPGETIAATAVRETKEETAVEVEVTGLVGIYTDPHHVIAYKNGEVRQEFNICFRGRALSSTTRTSSESMEARFVDPAELDGLAMHPSTRLRIEHSLDPTRGSPYIG
jgi:ADP-ribose pyrophosphatase YjhB (NUDIX family)